MTDGDRTRGKEPLESTQAKEDLMENLRRDELRGMKFYFDENWKLVYLPEEASSPSNLSNHEVEHPVPVYLIPASSRRQLEPKLGQAQGRLYSLGNSSVKPEKPSQSAHALQNLPPQKLMAEHVPSMPQGNFPPKRSMLKICTPHSKRQFIP